MTVRFRPLVAAAMLLVAAQSASAQTPTPTDIGNLGGGSASVSAVAGDFVVGDSRTGTAVDAFGNQVGHAYVWSASTHTMLDIGALFPNAGLSRATSVNSHGEVVGLYYAPDYSTATGFYWSQATGVVTIGAISGNNGGSILINENGTVASVDPNGHVFRWTRTGGAQDLGATGWDAPYGTEYNGGTYVTGINARGDIVGNSGAGSAGFAVSFIAYGSANTLTLLSSPGLTAPPPPWGGINTGGVNIQVNAINDSGVVVGTYWDFGFIYEAFVGYFNNFAVHNSHAFKWTSARGFTDLGNLGVSFQTPGGPANFAASAKAINNSGEIVGYSYLPTGGYAPFSYDPVTGSLTQLPALYPGDIAAQATGINDDGVIVGYANMTAAAVMWVNGVLTELVPSLLPLQWPGAPLIKGSMIAGGGLDQNWNGHAWVLSLPSSNQRPDCSAATASPATIWSPNHKMVPIAITGVTDPDGDAVTITATSVKQDEVVRETGLGSGNTAPDATLSPLAVRAERNGNPKSPGNGRVYHIDFTADDGNGGMCTGTVKVCVPHDQGKGSACVDGRPLFDSLAP